MGCDAQSQLSTNLIDYELLQQKPLEVDAKELEFSESDSFIQPTYEEEQEDVIIEIKEQDIDVITIQQLFNDIKREFIVPKLRQMPLKYTKSQSTHMPNGIDVSKAVELSTQQFVEISSMNLKNVNQIILDQYLYDAKIRSNMISTSIFPILDIYFNRETINLVFPIAEDSIDKLVTKYHGITEVLASQIAKQLLISMEYFHQYKVLINSINIYNINYTHGLAVFNSLSSFKRSQKQLILEGQAYYICPNFLLTELQNAQHNEQQSKQRHLKKLKKYQTYIPDYYQLGCFIYHALVSKPMFFQYKEISTLLFALSRIKRFDYYEYLQDYSDECVQCFGDIIYSKIIYNNINIADYKWFSGNKNEQLQNLKLEEDVENYNYEQYASSGNKCINQLGKIPNVQMLECPPRIQRKRKRQLHNLYDETDHYELFSSRWK